MTSEPASRSDRYVTQQGSTCTAMKWCCFAVSTRSRISAAPWGAWTALMSMSWAMSRAVSFMNALVLGAAAAGRGGRSRVCTQYSYRSATTRSSASSMGRPPL